jgi:hypothetical protein
MLSATIFSVRTPLTQGKATMSGKKNTHSRHNEAALIPEMESETDEVTLHSVYRELMQLKSYLAGLRLFTGKRTFNNKTLSEYLGISTRTLQNWRDAGMISFTQIKEVIIYSEDDVDAFLKKHKRVAFR